MPRRSDSTGVDQTCPYIDKVRDWIESIEWSEDEADLAAIAPKMSEILEQIRSMNLDLRNFGNKYYDELQDMEKDRDYYKNLSEKQEREIISLQEEVRDLEKTLAEQ